MSDRSGFYTPTNGEPIRIFPVDSKEPYVNFRNPNVGWYHTGLSDILPCPICRTKLIGKVKKYALLVLFIMLAVILVVTAA